MLLNKDQQIKDLTKLNADLENYFRNTIIPQLFFDKNLTLRKFTPAAMKQFKLSSIDIGRSIYDIQNRLRYPSIIENVNWVIETAEILEKEIQTTDLSWYQMNIIPYINFINKEPNGIIITFVDITNRVKDLKEQEKIISEYETLLDTISHDIKNRLSGMSLSIQLLNDTSLTNKDNKEEVKLYLDTLEAGVTKINIILTELVASRDQKRKYEAVKELINIESILEDVKLALINEIKKSKATIKWEVNSSEIIFPRRQLRSILYNLVNNAIKFKSQDRDPEILIKTTREDSYMVISVKDNGIGIDPKNYKDIFPNFSE